jgi:hypothetical protein
MSNNFCTVSAALLGALASVQPAGAQSAPAPASAARSVDPQAVVTEVRRIIAERYVLPERRPALDAVLAEGLSSGRYRVTDPVRLAQLINADLERVGRDKHLNFSYSGEAPRPQRPGGPPDLAHFFEQVRDVNHGIAELKVLPGNVRYMDYRGFNWIAEDGAESRAALDNALQFLSGGDAVIIDIRRNGGGSPEAVQHLVSHFMEADRPLMTFHMNGSETPDRTASLRELRVPRMIGKPLYVLTSGDSGSAAEEFAGHVGGYRLGELVGQTTAGAGFRNDVLPIEGGFRLSVSVGRAVLASTGRDWEGVGIAPTIEVPVAAALDAAHAHALRRIAASAGPEDRPRLEALAEGVAARRERRSPGLPLNAYAGTYGERTVKLEGGELMFERGGVVRERLVPLGGHGFALEGNPGMRVAFVAAGNRVTAMEIGPAGAPPRERIDRGR